MRTDETSGLGVGLSTASSLTGALGGCLVLTSGKTSKFSGTEATFNIYMTDKDHLETYQEDLLKIKKFKKAGEN